MSLVGLIGRIDAGGHVTVHPLPTGAAGPVGPVGICAGPDGALWVALETGALARLTRRPPR